MSRRPPAGAFALALAVLLGGCTGAESTPWVVEAGPTADVGDFARPEPAPTTEGRSDRELAVAEIEDRLAAREDPLQVITGELPDGTPVEVEVLSLAATPTSLLARFRLTPRGDEPVELDLEGGLSGTLARGDRSLADVELVDDATGRRLLPTVFRPDVTKEDEGQRCLCSLLPRVLPADGVTLSVHYARPAEGFDLVRLSVPGLDEGAPVPVG